jgi:hypothetical protein
MRTDDRTTRLGSTTGEKRAPCDEGGDRAPRSDARVAGRPFVAQKAGESTSCFVEHGPQSSSLTAPSDLADGSDDTWSDHEINRGDRQFNTRSRTNDMRIAARGSHGRGLPGGRWPLAGLLLLLSACAQQPPVKPKASAPPINLSGYSPAFRQGFEEGCDTARGNMRRNEQRYTQDGQYARGWDDGRAICAKR